VSVPGVIAVLIAPVVTQLSVLLEPELMLAGLAVKDVTVGTGAVCGVVVVGSGLLVEPPQAVRTAHASRTKTTAQSASRVRSCVELALRLTVEVGSPKRKPSVAASFMLIPSLRWPQGGMPESGNASRFFCNLGLGRGFATTLRLLLAALVLKRASAANYITIMTRCMDGKTTSR